MEPYHAPEPIALPVAPPEPGPAEPAEPPADDRAEDAPLVGSSSAVIDETLESMTARAPGGCLDLPLWPTLESRL